jgi:hypothetical protein
VGAGSSGGIVSDGGVVPGSSGGIASDGGAGAPPCPATPPWPGNPCAQVGQECDYSGAGTGYCGNVMAVCAVQGYWQSAGEQCPSPGCPSALPADGQSCSQQQQGLDCRYPLNALTCDGGVCGSGWSCGTIGCTSTSGATCDEWRCTCGNGGGSWSCGANDCHGGDGGAACDYDAGNDPGCPAAYSFSLSCFTACTPVGLSCLYPGAGSIAMSNGCQSAAQLQCVADDDSSACQGCRGDAGQWTCANPLDAGPDVQVGHWVAF